MFKKERVKVLKGHTLQQLSSHLHSHIDLLDLVDGFQGHLKRVPSDLCENGTKITQMFN